MINIVVLHKPFYYVGSTSMIDSFFKNNFGKYAVPVMIGVKLCILILCTITYIYL